MGIQTSNPYKSQSARLRIKTLSQQMKQTAIHGAGLTPWEAEILIKEVESTFFNDPELRGLLPGQTLYSCVAESEGAGKPLKECKMVTAILSVYNKDDEEGLASIETSRQVERRQRKLVRICSEAKLQGGLLSQEDLALLMMCDVKTIRRDVKSLKENEILLPTRGQIKDIGPGLTHREVIIKKWLEGKEEKEICTLTKHSMGSVENYLQTFKRAVYLRREKKFTDHEIAVVIGASSSLVRNHLKIYEDLKDHGIVEIRMQEICLNGEEFYREQGEKKDSLPPSASNQTRRKL